MKATVSLLIPFKRFSKKASMKYDLNMHHVITNSISMIETRIDKQRQLRSNYLRSIRLVSKVERSTLCGTSSRKETSRYRLSRNEQTLGD